MRDCGRRPKPKRLGDTHLPQSHTRAQAGAGCRRVFTAPASQDPRRLVCRRWPCSVAEIITWLDDHSRYALHVSAHARISGPIVLATFRQTVAEHGVPASTLTDNGMVYTTLRRPRRPQRLRLFFLPPYSPELNPDEWVWKNVKHDRVGRVSITSADDLKHRALAALHRLQNLPHLVRGFFADHQPVLHHSIDPATNESLSTSTECPF